MLRPVRKQVQQTNRCGMIAGYPGSPEPAPGDAAMRLVLFLGLVLVLVARRSFAADFPAPDKLPARAELPDPLIMLNGDKVTTKKQWLEKRRPELKELFQYYVYGRLPEPRKVEGKVVHEDKQAFG